MKKAKLKKGDIVYHRLSLDSPDMIIISVRNSIITTNTDEYEYYCRWFDKKTNTFFGDWFSEIELVEPEIK